MSTEIKEKTAKVIRFHKTGGPEVFQIDKMPIPVPAAGEVSIRIKAIGLNRLELLFREGVYFVNPVLPSKTGIEAAGIVEAVGADVNASWIGKEVSVLPAFDSTKYGTAAEVAVIPVYAIAEKPANLTFEEGASVWMQYLTAWGALKFHGKLSPGDFVIIDAAASAVGMGIVEMAKVEGLKTIALVRTPDKKKELIAVGADYVIVTSEEDLVRSVMEITGGKGANLIVDFIAGQILEDLAKAASVGGKILMGGYLGTDKRGYNNGIPTPYPFYEAVSKNITIQGFSSYFVLFVPEIFEQAKAYVLEHLKNGDFRARIDKTFSLEEFSDSHRYMESNQSAGKIVVTV